MLRFHSTLHSLARRLKGQSGQSTVELALLVIPLMVIVVMIAEFGSAFHFWIDQTHLASSGARYAAVNRTPDGSPVRTYIRSQMSSDALKNGGTAGVPNASKICVSFPSGATVGQPVKVEISTNYHFMSLLGASVDKTITGSATMRLERTPDPAMAGCT
jgi:Flp pilus assembly protein TadG